MNSKYWTAKKLAETYRARIVVVSKNQSLENISRIYDYGQREFAENRFQNLSQRKSDLPADIHWHMIGHLQSNKVKPIIPLVRMIQSVDSSKLAILISQASEKFGITLDGLIQIKISRDEGKSGIQYEELLRSLDAGEWASLDHLRIRGVMGISSLDGKTTRNEFKMLRSHFDHLQSHYFSKYETFDTISMGMSSDYQIALEEGSNMIRLGSYVFEDL